MTANGNIIYLAGPFGFLILFFIRQQFGNANIQTFWIGLRYQTINNEHPTQYPPALSKANVSVSECLTDSYSFRRTFHLKLTVTLMITKQKIQYNTTKPPTNHLEYLVSKLFVEKFYSALIIKNLSMKIKYLVLKTTLDSEEII